MPAGAAAASKEAAGQQRAHRWPGSCSQGAVADANHLHGVAAVVVSAQRSKSCSAGGRQHTAKKLVFQQVSLAQQCSLQSPGAPAQGFRAAPATAAGSDAKAGAAGQSVAFKQAADLAAGAVAAPKRPARQDVVVGPSAGQTGVKLAEAGVVAVASQAVPNAQAGVLAAAAVSRKIGSSASVSKQHGHAGSDGLGLPTEAVRGSSGSQEQWETAVSKLRSLAEKHSQDSHEGAAIDHAIDLGPEAGPQQEHRSAPADEQPLAREGDSATPGFHVPPITDHPKHVQALQQQVAVSSRHVDQAAALLGQPPVDSHSTEVQTCQGKPESKAGAGVYTGLSRLRALMRQQKQQLGTDPLLNTGQNPGSSVTVAAGLKQGQSTAGAPQLGQQHPQHTPSMEHTQRGVVKAKAHRLGETLADQGHKRKRLEAGACDQVKSHSAALASHVLSAQAPCKRQCLPATSTHAAHSPAACGDQNAERHSLVYGKRPAGAAQPPSLTAPHHSGAAEAGCGSASIHDKGPLVAWPMGCEPNLAPALQHDSQQLPPAVPVAAATGSVDSASAAANAENTVKAVVDETTAVAAAAEVLVGEASGGVPPVGAAGGIPLVGEAAGGVPLAGQQDKSQGGSEVQQGGLRLDLSSEEDPLLCTQKLPSSQGTAPIR